LEWADSTTSLDVTSRILPGPGPPINTRRALDRSRFVADPQVNKLISSRLKYALDKISAAPLQLVLENQMPWCHPQLYDEGMPRSMQCVIENRTLRSPDFEVVC